MEKVFFHVDLDAFFASVEQLDHPEYKGKPVIVGGLPGDRRAVVSTASYEARKFGVHSAMPVFQAAKQCPKGIFVRPNMKRYHEKSREVMSIFYNYSPDVRQMSVDEAFIDMTGTEKLFGKPLDAAKKLKAEVLGKTGLTVSIGIASTKYCAKIASGIKKPDGLFEIPNGKEQDFMLSLPLSKLWGAGKKTQEKLKNNGITSTKDIFCRSQKLLQSIFGQAAGLFLYNAVRGNEYEDFNSKQKNRSLSAETTYDFDLTDLYAIETALLELCHTVMFRSLKEKVRSKSVSLKIRYEDFSTVSVQESSERYVSSVDDLFERIKFLFAKKHNSRLSIRLLGVCLQNLEDDKEPRSKELFDFGEEKKRKLEQAILKAQQKDPSLKITKARLLKKETIFSLFFVFFSLSGNRTDAQAISTSTAREADGAAAIVFDTENLPLEESGEKSSLFNKNFFGNEIDFLAEGYWKSSVSSSLGYSFGFGTTPSLSLSSPVFSQNVDLSLWLEANKKYYFEAAFADGFEENTVAAGYNGKGYLRSLRIGNRGIVFPEIYALDDFSRGIGGGKNQAPGFSLNFKGQKWRSDFAFRYDLLKTESKTWFGMNAVSTNSIQLSSYNTGSQYVLPSENLAQSIKSVYVQSSDGNYKDSKGRKYKKLGSAQFLVVSSQNLLLLSKDAKASRKNGELPSVAVSFSCPFSETDKDFSDFLKDVQSAFGSVNLEKFFYNFSGEINSEEVLFLQHPSGFSPFQNASRYDAGILSADDAAVASSYSGTVSSDFSAVISDDETAFYPSDFFDETHTYIDVFKENSDSGAGASIANAEIRFPFAKSNPGIYLGYGSNNDLLLRVRNYSEVSRLDIGTKAVPGTVTVYKNSVIDSGASYDSSTGAVSLSSAVSSTDKIFVTWQEESEDAQNASFAAAAGFKYDFSENLSADISSSGRFSYSQNQNFADSSYSSPSYGTLAAGIEYKNELLSVKNSMAATLENINTTGKYRILGMDDTDSTTSYLQKDAGADLPEDFTPSLNSRSDDEVFPTLKSNSNMAEEAQSGFKTEGISGYAIPFAWNFESDSSSVSETQWAALGVSLTEAKSSLSLSSVFEIALKNISGDIYDFDLYLQLGVSSDDDFSFEDDDKIPTWKISENSGEDVLKSFNTASSSWQTVRVSISDSDRAFFANSSGYSARLIAVPKNSAVNAANKNGEILIGPYECKAGSFITEIPENVKISQTQTSDFTLSSSKLKDFNSGSQNTVQTFDFKFTCASDEQSLIFRKYFSAVDFSYYKNLCFYFKLGSSFIKSVNFIFDTKDDDGTKTAAEFSFPPEKISSEWQKFEVSLKDKKVSANGYENTACIDTSVIPTRFTIEIVTNEISEDDAENGAAGSFSIDEIYLSETSLFLDLQDKASFNLEKNGELLKAGDFPILSDLKIRADGSAASALNTDSLENKSIFSGAASAEATISKLKIAISGAKDSDADTKTSLCSASHSISSAEPIFKAFTFYENYSFNGASENLSKKNSAKISFEKFSLPLIFSMDAKTDSNSWSRSQELSGESSFSAGNFSLTAKSSVSQKLKSSASTSEFKTDNYFSSWKNISKFEFSAGDENAKKRKTVFSANTKYNFQLCSLAPEISFSSAGIYKFSSSSTFKDDSTVKITVPFSKGKNGFSFSWTKLSGSASYTEEGGDYFSDAKKLAEKLGEKKALLAAAPFYDLASKKIQEDVYKISHKQDSSGDFTTYYTGLYSLGWKRGFSADKYDFFIPSSLKFDFSRDIRTATTVSDIFQAKATAANSALNIFGKYGSIPLFSFYEQDEFTTSFSAALKIPRDTPSKISAVVSGYSQLTIYFKEKNSLKTGAEGSFEEKNDWDGKLTIIWKRNSKNSLAGGLCSLFKKFKGEKGFRITKTDSLNFSAASASTSSSVTKKYSFDFSHAADTQITKYVSLNTAAGAGYYATWGKAAVLNGSLAIGATIKF